MRTIALVVEYDGTHFHGFQRQTTLPTVAGELERALSQFFGHPVTVVGAGRTDAGVHATGQVVSFATSSDVELVRVPVALSAMLRERRIAVLRAVERQPGFSARRGALARTYRYRILNRPAPSPLHERRVFFVRSPLDLELMRAAVAALVGTHDFTSFCALPPESGNSRRTIERLELTRAASGAAPDAGLLDLDITADSFLHQMVRIIAGTLIEVGRGKRKPEDVARILAAKDRAQAGITAPPHALYLTHVRYEPPI